MVLKCRQTVKDPTSIGETFEGKDRAQLSAERPITSKKFTLWLDATYIKVRQNGRIVSVTVIVAVNSDGRGPSAHGRVPWGEVLGMTVGAAEAETFWTASLCTLARRGLCGVKLVISDAHEGPKAAAAKVRTPLGSAAARTLRAMCWLMPASRVVASSPPSSPPRLPRRMPKPRGASGARDAMGRATR